MRGIFLFKKQVFDAILPLLSHYLETDFMIKLTFPRFFLTALIALASIVPAAAQTQRSAQELYDEVEGYVKSRIAGLAAVGKRPTRDEISLLEGEQTDLASKNAEKIGAFPKPTNQDLMFIGLLHEKAGNNNNKALTAFRRVLKEAEPSDISPAVQVARSRMVVYAGREKLFDEMEKAYAGWLQGTAAYPSMKASLEGSMAAAYFNGKKYDQAIKYAQSAFNLIKNLEAKTWKERSQKTDIYATLVETLVLSYQKGDRKDDALSLLAETRALAFTIPSASLYEKVMKMVGKYGVSEKKLMEKIESMPKADPAPEFAVKKWMGQEPSTLEGLRGKVVLLDFWATWCGPCISTFPRLRNWHKKYSPQGLTIVGITSFYGRIGPEKVSQADELNYLEKFKEENKLPYGFAITQGEETASKYGINAIPATFLLDRHGVVRYIGVGASKEEAENLEDMIKKVLAEQ
jgi:thiol-disulfide isomerase/thioredoxin